MMPSPFRLLAAALVLIPALHAHDPGLGTTQIELTKDGISATVGLAPNDLRALLPQSAPTTASWTQSDFKNVEAVLQDLALNLVEVRDDRGTVKWTDHGVSLVSGNSVLFRVGSNLPPKGRLIIRSLAIKRLPPGHRDYISVSDASGKTLLETLMGAEDAPARVDLALATAPAALAPHSPAESPPTFWGFLRLGIGHIWTGYDHLLFLFGLLIVCRSFRSIVGIISCFTLAHSITLALATLNIVNLPSRFVEPMIAASIFFVGVENLIRSGAEPRGRWALTFAFGLVHGFGFASVLRELGIGSNGHSLAMPLLTFNLGVEVGQISIAAVVLPIVWRLRKNPLLVRRGVPVLSVLVAAAGLYWFLERTMT